MRQWTRQDICEALAGYETELAQFHVKRLRVFGSVARNQAEPGSDIDFLVEFDQKTFDNFMGVRCLLEDVFDCKIDLVTLEALRPELREAILEEAVDAA